MLLTLTTPLLLLLYAFLGSAAARLMELPSGADLLVDHFETSFRCPEAFGYFADEDHHCRVFHVCNPMATGMQQFSFLCGNQTVFDQLNLACSHPEDAIPCEYSKHFSYVNERIGTDYNLHYDADIERAAPYVPNKAGRFLFDSAPPTQSAQQDDPVASVNDNVPREPQLRFDTPVQDFGTPAVQQDTGGDVRSHQRQSISAVVGHDFTVFHPQGDPPSTSGQQQQFQPQTRQQQPTRGERRALRNSIRRRPRARANSFV